jgi:hypothetical protein
MPHCDFPQMSPQQMLGQVYAAQQWHFARR